MWLLLLLLDVVLKRVRARAMAFGCHTSCAQSECEFRSEWWRNTQPPGAVAIIALGWAPAIAHFSCERDAERCTKLLKKKWADSPNVSASQPTSHSCQPFCLATIENYIILDYRAHILAAAAASAAASHTRYVIHSNFPPKPNPFKRQSLTQYFVQSESQHCDGSLCALSTIVWDKRSWFFFILIIAAVFFCLHFFFHHSLKQQKKKTLYQALFPFISVIMEHRVYFIASKEKKKTRCAKRCVLCLRCILIPINVLIVCFVGVVFFFGRLWPLCACVCVFWLLSTLFLI